MAAAIRFFREYQREESQEDHVFFCYSLLSGTAALLFSASRSWDYVWWLFHGLRLAAYLLVLGYVTKIFRDLRRGQVKGFLAKIKDAERDLIENSARLNLALEAAQMGTWDWDLNTKRIYWSEMHEILFGYAPP